MCSSDLPRSMSSEFKMPGSLALTTLQYWNGRPRRVESLSPTISTLAKHAFDRVAARHPMPGVFGVRSLAPIGRTIDDLILLARCSHDREWEGQVRFLPV